MKNKISNSILLQLCERFVVYCTTTSNYNCEFIKSNFKNITWMLIFFNNYCNYYRIIRVNILKLWYYYSYHMNMWFTCQVSWNCNWVILIYSDTKAKRRKFVLASHLLVEIFSKACFPIVLYRKSFNRLWVVTTI